MYKLRDYGVNLKKFLMHLPVVCGVNIREFVYMEAYISWGKTTYFCMRVRPISYGGKLHWTTKFNFSFFAHELQ